MAKGLVFLYSTSSQRKRLQWIDIAKGIGIILVVIGHCNPPAEIEKIIFSFHMPLFFFVSGYVYRQSDAGTSHFLARTKKDFVRLILPYVATVCLVAIFWLLIRAQGKPGAYDSLSALFKSALYGSGSNHNGIRLIGEIWFLLALFWARRIMDAVFLCENRLFRLFLVIGIAGAGIALAAAGLWIPANVDIAFVAVGFMYAGWLLQKKPGLFDNPAFLCLMLLIGAASLFSSGLRMSSRRYYDMWFIVLPGAVALSILVCKASMLLEMVKGVRSFLAFVGRHSLLFMCVHSLDWRMPFPRFGQSFVSAYRGAGWLWILSSSHRFLFDLLITLLVLGGLKLFRLIRGKNRKNAAESL